MIVLILSAIWGGIWWRLRGGALTALTGFDPGTGGMRAIAAVGMAAPLVAFDWVWLVMIPTLWIGWSCAGWGSYQGMGKETVIADKCLITTGLRVLGVRAEFWIDVLGMAIEGLIFAVFLSIPIVVILQNDWWLPLIGIGFSPLYLCAQWSPWLPDCRRFARAGSEWAEVLVGAWIAVVVTAVVGL